MQTLLRSVLFALVLATAGLSGAPAQAVPAECYERSILLYSLATEYGERLEQSRKVGDSGLLESFKSEGGTWTIVYSNDEGLACVLAAGAGLEIEEEAAQQIAELAI
jgi:hypothetical protein